MKIMNPKLAQAVRKPLAAVRAATAAPAGRPKSGIGMTAGPKPKPASQMAAASAAGRASSQMEAASAARAAAARAAAPKGGIGMTGGPKPSIPKPVKPSPARPPLNAAPVTGVTRGRVEQNYRGIPGLVNASMDTPNFGGAASNRIANAGTGGFKRAKADSGMPTPPSTNVNPVRPGMTGGPSPVRTAAARTAAAVGAFAKGRMK